MRRLAIVAPLSLYLVTVGLGAFAQAPEMPPPPQDARMDTLLGTWEGTCQVRGMAMSVRTSWAWELGHYFLVSESSGTLVLPDGSSMSHETHYYNQPQSDGTYAGTFYDSMGGTQDYTMRWDGEQLVAEWPDQGDGAGRWVGTPNADGTLHSSASMVGPDGAATEVASCDYTRAAE